MSPPRFGKVFISVKPRNGDFLSDESNKGLVLSWLDEVLNDEFKDILPDAYQPNAPDSTWEVTLASYHPDKMKYQYTSSKDGLMVFSEIYYAPGWIVKIDGQEVDHFRVNYVLRGLQVPAGNHEITFEFRPASYYTGEVIGGAGSIVFLLLILGLGFMEMVKSRTKKNG